MNDDRNAASGCSARILPIAARKRSPLPHRFMRRRRPGRRVLQRQVEVRHDGVELEHRRHQRVVHLRRVEVQQPDARQARRRERVEPAQQRRRARPAHRCRARTTRDPARRARAPTRLAPRANALRLRSTRACAIVAVPRNDGMAQNAHARSQPSAIFTYAHGADGAGRGSSKRSRTPVGLRLQHDVAPDRPRPRTRRPRRLRAARPPARRRSARPCNR